MQNNTSSTDSPDAETRFQPVQAQSEPTKPNSSEHHPPPLGMELTGYRLLTASVVLGLGIPKAVSSYRGQSLISVTFDWVAGMIIAFVLFRLGVIDAKHPELLRVFLGDLAPPILKFMARHAGFFCFLSFAFVLHAAKQLRTALGARRDEEHAHEITADFVTVELLSTVLGLGVSLWVFFSLCWKVVRRRGFEEDHSLLLNGGFLMLIVYAVYLMVTFCLSKLQDWHQLRPILTATMANFPWTSTCFAVILFVYGPGSDVRGLAENLVLVAVAVAFGLVNAYLGISRESQLS